MAADGWSLAHLRHARGDAVSVVVTRNNGERRIYPSAVTMRFLPIAQGGGVAGLAVRDAAGVDIAVFPGGKWEYAEFHQPGAPPEPEQKSAREVTA